MENNSVKKLGCWAQIQHLLGFALRSRRSTWVSLVFFLLLYIIVRVYYGRANLPTLLESLQANWSNTEAHINIVLQLLTFFVIVAVWFTGLNRDWEASLDKYLSVTFTYDGNAVEHLCGQYVPFFDDSDIRALGQSIGKINHDNKWLDFDLQKHKMNKSICIDTSGAVSCKPFWHYEVVFPLLKPVEKKQGTQKTINKKESITKLLQNIANVFAKLQKDLAHSETNQIAMIMQRLDEVHELFNDIEGKQNEHDRN